MSKSFADLKKKKKKSIAELQQEVEKTQGGSNEYQDERMWRPQEDASGLIKCVIRFLPSSPADEEELNWVKFFKHAFEGPNGWYISNCLSTIGEFTDDPVNQYLNKVKGNRKWDELDEKTQNLMRHRGRKARYISNVLVIDDPVNPDNNGKVMLYEYGPAIFEKIKDEIIPDPALDKEPHDVFDAWEGKNFKLVRRQKKTKDYPDYDLSEFLEPSPIADSDDKIEAVWNQEYALSEFVDEKNEKLYKPYETLKRRLMQVLGDDAEIYFENEDTDNVDSMNNKMNLDSMDEDDDELGLSLDEDDDEESLSLDDDELDSFASLAE